MTSLLSAISGQFAKSIILGTFFPVTMISILAFIFVGPLVQPTTYLQDQLKRLAFGEDKWAIVTLTFAVVVLTGILHNLNIPIIRLYEGYPWKESWLGWFFKRRKKKKLRESIPLRLELRSLADKLQNAHSDPGYMASISAQQNLLALYLNTQLPDQEELVLPTRFGNVIRCFERYSSLAYGMDAIVLWPRLVAKIDSGFATSIEASKISLDFMVNCSFLSALTGTIIVIIKLSASAPLTFETAWPWLWRVLLFLGLAWIFYEFAIVQAAGWGEQVKSAFDLYRMDLLKALGYQRQLSYPEEEKQLWQKINRQLLFVDLIESPLAYKEPITKVISAKPTTVSVVRVVGEPELNGTIPVTIVLTNSGLENRTSQVRVLETIPEGFSFVVHSFSSSCEVQLYNFKPLQFTCKPISSGATVTIRYAIRQTGS